MGKCCCSTFSMICLLSRNNRQRFLVEVDACSLFYLSSCQQSWFICCYFVVIIFSLLIILSFVALSSLCILYRLHFARACFKKNSWLHITTEICPLWLLKPKITWKFSFHPSKILMTFFSHWQQTGYFSPFLRLSTPPLFITAKTAFRHCTFSFITVHFVHHCTLKHALQFAYSRVWVLI